MFIDRQSRKNVDEYMELLRIMGSLSNLFSDSTKPYLDYRVAENLFCQCLHAQNLSRSDCSADATKEGVGVGIKTFLCTGTKSSMQKIAEFNKLRDQYAEKSDKATAVAISQFRNDRLSLTARIHSLNNMLYHLILRDTGKIFIAESPMNTIDIANIKVTSTSNKVIAFSDGLNEYCFNRSKSVLYQRFFTKNILHELDIAIIANPFEVLKDLLGGKCAVLTTLHTRESDSFVLLPLFSTRGGTKHVPEKSGLNQWNASGRTRYYDEVYIPIPAHLHRHYPDFFPARDTPFTLLLPSGETLRVKVCQDGSKSLMSNPNTALGQWLLRDILQLTEGELLTYEKLTELGIDSVTIYKDNRGEYSINFTNIGRYDTFTTTFTRRGEAGGEYDA